MVGSSIDECLKRQSTQPVKIDSDVYLSDNPAEDQNWSSNYKRQENSMFTLADAPSPCDNTTYPVWYTLLDSTTNEPLTTASPGYNNIKIDPATGKVSWLLVPNVKIEQRFYV